jgi:hypothetical protein
VREPGQSVCGTGSGQVARGGAAAGVGGKPETDSAGAVYGGGVDLSSRGRCGVGGQRDTAARAERVAANSALADSSGGESGLAGVWVCAALGACERAAVWRSSSATGAEDKSG